MNSQIKAVTKSLTIVLWFYMASLIISFLIRMGYRSENHYTEVMKAHSHLVNCLVYILIFIGVYVVDNERKIFLKSFRSLSIHGILTFIVMGLGAYGIGAFITNLLIDVFPTYYEISQNFNAQEPILRWIAMVILPPIVEEYLFRFKIQGYLEEGFGKTIAILGQAILFGMLHYYTLQKIYAIVLGILFGYMKDKKQTIQVSIWMHMTVNFLGWLAGCFFS